MNWTGAACESGRQATMINPFFVSRLTGKRYDKSPFYEMVLNNNAVNDDIIGDGLRFSF